MITHVRQTPTVRTWKNDPQCPFLHSVQIREYMIIVLLSMNAPFEPARSHVAGSHPPSGREEQADVIELPASVLRALGWTSFIATTRIEDSDVRVLLQMLALESCAHSWRKCNPLWDTRLLSAWENEHRPTEIIGYYGITPGGKRQIVGAATVAHKIHRRFPHSGFPVLARAFIDPAYRDRGLYSRILEHRLSFCSRHWGAGLKGIHLGSLEPKVWHVIGRVRAGSPPFVHIGNEPLEIQGNIHIVRDFLMFAPGYGRALLESVRGGHEPAPAPVVALRRALTCMLRAEPGGHHYERVRESFARVRDSTDWFATRDSSPIEQFLGFCEAIPLSKSSL